MDTINYANVRDLTDVPSFHDAEIIRIDHRREDRELAVHLKRASGDTGVFRFTGVIAQRIVDFTEQNVVSRLLISPRYPFSSDEVRRWVQWVNSRDTVTAVPVDDERADQYARDDLVTGQRALFVLEPSCGAQMAVLCESVWLKS
jgi:pyruvate-formate lyase-activating enzyme